MNAHRRHSDAPLAAFRQRSDVRGFPDHRKNYIRGTKLNTMNECLPTTPGGALHWRLPDNTREFPLIPSSIAKPFEAHDVDEAAILPGEVVGTLVTSDPDAGTKLHYRLVGADSDLFNLNSNGEISLDDGKVLDFELKPLIQLTVEMEDER